MIQGLLLDIQMTWVIFINIMNNTVQNKFGKYWLYLKIWLPICLVIKTLNPIVNELFIGGRKLNISLVFITQTSFAVPQFKLDTIFCYGNSKQKGTSTNCI